MSKKNTSNSSAEEKHETTADFAGHVDEHQFKGGAESLLRAPKYVYPKNAFPVDVDFRNTTILVGPDTVTYSTIKSPRQADSLMNAANYLTRGNVFPFLKTGLHLQCPKDKIVGITLDDNIGVLDWRYVADGENDPFARFVPAAPGFVKLGVTHGFLTAYPLVFHPWVEGTKNEPQSWGRDRNTIALHDFIDALIAGEAFLCSPVFYKGDREIADSDMPLVQRQVAWVAAYKEVWSMTDDEARISYIQNVINKNVYRTAAKVKGGNALKIENGEEIVAVADSVPLRDPDGTTTSGRMGTFEDLKGHTCKVWYQKYGEVNGLWIPGVNTTWADFVETVTKSRLNVEVLDIPVVQA